MNFYYKDFSQNVGAFIHLVQGEITVAINKIIDGCELENNM